METFTMIVISMLSLGAVGWSVWCAVAWLIKALAWLLPRMLVGGFAVWLAWFTIRVLGG